MLAALFTGPVLTALINALLGPLESIFHDYTQGQITKEQLAERLQAAMLSTLAQIDAQFTDSLTKTYTAFITTAATNPVMTRAWSVVLYSQLAILLWQQWAIPLIVALGFVQKYPSAGVTGEWAYALVALCLGAPALSTRIGSVANNIKQMLKGS